MKRFLSSLSIVVAALAAASCGRDVPTPVGIRAVDIGASALFTPVDGGLYVLANTSTAAAPNVYLMNPTTAASTFVTTTATGVRGLAIDPTTGSFIISYGSIKQTSTRGVALLDPGTGAITAIGGTKAFVALAFDATGQLYGAENPQSGATDGNLYKINKTTGAATLLTNVDVGNERGAGLAYDPFTQKLFFKGWPGALASVNTTTGAVTYEGQINLPYYASHAMAFDASGKVYYPQHPTIGDFFASAAAGNLLNPAIVGNSGLRVWDMAFFGAVDNTPPVITPTVTGTLGADGWYTSDVDVSWSVTDDESSFTSTGCGPTSVTANTASVTFTCSAESAGGSATSSVTLKRDASAPDVSPTITGTLGANGWYTSDIGVGWATTDATSGVASSTGCDASSVTSDIASITFTCSATNGAGLSAEQAVTLKRDAMAPTVAFAGNAIAYTVDQTIAISCSTSDAMSGVATSNCATANGAAYTFDLGAHTLTASATDYAGNDASASTTFTVSVTYGSLCALTRQFVAQAGIANSMCVKLDNAYRSEFRGSAGAAQNQVQAFINEVRAQSGKALTAAQAGILTTLAGAF